MSLREKSYSNNVGEQRDSFFLWDIGKESANIKRSYDCVVWKWCVFNETNIVSCVFIV